MCVVFFGGTDKENTAAAVANSVFILSPLAAAMLSDPGFSIGRVLITAAACVFCGFMLLVCWNMDKK